MFQFLGQDILTTLAKTSTTQVKLPAGSRVTVGGQQITNVVDIYLNTGTSGIGGIDTGSVAANKLYTVYAVPSLGTIALVASLSTTAPTGFTAYGFAGIFDTNASSEVLTANKTSFGHIGDEYSGQLTEAQLQALKGPGWILEDGRNVAGSAWAALTGNSTIPDARGVIRRGQNNGRSGSTGNPDGTALGGSQGDATAKNGLALSDPGHEHFGRSGTTNKVAGAFGVSFTTISDVTSGASAVNVPSGSVTTGVSLGTGDNETRMRNITTNHFIKIN